MCTQAAHWGLVDANPCLGIQRFREVARARWLSADELARLGSALTAVEKTDRRRRSAIAAIRFITLTGVRKSEALGLRWEWFDARRAHFRIPDSKSGKPTCWPPAAPT